ncbi:MAG TPA: hypothetical protein VF198_12650 [Vicinamibacterales bacterium]
MSSRSSSNDWRDGETTQFTASTDKVSGEVIRIEVGMSVVK